MRAVGAGAVVARLAAWLRGVPGAMVEDGEERVVVSDAMLHERRVEEARLRDLPGWLW